ncbi:ABC transporter ATP-binding protein [Paenactinomyces guangxiensis]|uniref:ABC transporter ATP-binding protein n=1 Tax=Paenactinomyces guangxiensis TaxID=1490290 RepID=A0A7W1WP48_9BACL|nr:ABC transporter ATP-binding protein [Paenactinomyces guangxiensis]MBA4493461.1 ABC transporter ATP-binding protein [Paenactinomyces guangxiensis]MBH8590552.1 ABC transporter ATP-binding protein [Paenactinomyces guangxiensis]
MNNVKWILMYIKGIRLIYISSILLLLLESIAYIYTIQLQQKMIDDVIVNGMYSNFWDVLLLIILCYITYSLLFVINPFVQSKIHGSVKKVLTKEALSHLYRIPHERFQEKRTGQYVHFLSNEIPIVARFIGEDISDTIKYIVNTFVICLLIALTNIWMFVCVLALCMVYLKSVRYFSQKQKEISTHMQKDKGNLIAILEEGVASTREIIAFNQMKWWEAKYLDIFQRYYSRVIEEGKWRVKQIFTQESVTTCTYLIVLGFGVFLIFKGNITVGMLVVIYQLIAELIQSFEKTNRLIVDFSGKMVVVERVRNFIEDKKEKVRVKKLNEKIYSLRFDKVSFCYDQQMHVLQDLSLNIPIGKKVALVGASGSGKSTMAQLLIRHFAPQHGNINANDIPIDLIMTEEWTRKVGIVFQEPYLFANTIRENLLLGNHQVSEKDLVDMCKAMCIHDFIMSLPNGYDTNIGERGVTLSGGQKQRLALVRALLRNPEILILDEATSALDFNTERIVQNNIDRIRKGKTTIIIAHRLSTIKNADIIYVIRLGRVVESGKHDWLINHNNYYKSLVDAEKVKT